MTRLFWLILHCYSFTFAFNIFVEAARQERMMEEEKQWKRRRERRGGGGGGRGKEMFAGKICHG